MKKRNVARLTGLVLAFAMTATTVAFADDEVFISEEEYFASDETFMSEDETFVPEGETVIVEEEPAEPETEEYTKEDGDPGKGRGGIADEEAGIAVCAPDLEGDDLFSGMFVEEDVAIDQASGESLPSSYNVFELGKLPKVRNQGAYGCCWSFAAVGSAEADLIHDGKADKNIDLSELQIAYFTAHNFTAAKKGMDKDTYRFNPDKDLKYYLNNGGNGAFAAGVLMSGIGFVSESDLPYTLAGSTTNEEGSIADRYAQSLNSAMLTGVYCASTNDRDTVKRLIMEHGGVNTLIHAPGDKKTAKGECFFSEEYNSYITTYENVDHVIMLVGWDDDFSRDKFPAHKPERNGAWLVRNSWGTDGYDCNGYFWLSYEDSSLADLNAYAFDADTKVYNNCYSYAKAGTQCHFYDFYSKNDRIETKQKYHIDQGEKILASGIEFMSANVTCEIIVKGKPGHTAGKMFKTGLPGYYTVQLECPFEVTDPEGEDVDVTVTYIGNNLRVPIEGPGNHRVVNINVRTETESSGVTVNGDYHKELDSKVRLFTDDTVDKPKRKEDVVNTKNKKATIDKNSGSVQGLDSECGYSKLPEELKKNYSLKWSVENTDVAAIVGDNTGEEVSVKAVGAGSTYLTCECYYGGEVVDVSECELTVDPYSISYDLGELKLGEDVFSAYELPEWFFPGNEAQCTLVDVARAGYDFDGWYEDAGLTKKVTEELLVANEGGYFYKDLVLYPKWTKRQLTLSYQALRSDLSGYDDKTIEIAKLTVDDFNKEGNTYALPDAATLTGQDEVYGWSLSGYGAEAISRLGIDTAFNLSLTYEDQYYNSHYEQNDVLVLYPQYGTWILSPKNIKWSDDPRVDGDELVTATFEIISSSKEELAVIKDVPADNIEITDFTDSTWSNKGSITYKAVWERNGTQFGGSHTYELSPKKDDYKDPEWSWAKDTDAPYGYRVIARWKEKDSAIPEAGDDWKMGDDEKRSTEFEMEAVISSVTRSDGKIVMTAVVTMDDGTEIESSPFSVDAKNRSASAGGEQKEINAGEFTAVQADVLDLYDNKNTALIYFKGATTNAEPYSIKLTKGGDWYSVVYDEDDLSDMENGYAVIGLRLNEGVNTESLIKEAAKNNKLEFSVKGINSTNSVTCPLTLKTSYKAPKVKLAASSATFYEKLVTADTLEAVVYETSDLIKQGYDQAGWDADYCQKKGGSYTVVDNSSVEVDAASHSLKVTVPKSSYKNCYIRLHGSSWADDAYVYAKYDIKLAGGLPAIELTQKRITLNANNAGENEKVKVYVLAKGGSKLPDSVIKTLVVEGDDKLFAGLTVDKSRLNTDGSIVVTLGSKPARKGNCKLYITGTLPGEKKQKLTLTVNVSDTGADKAVRFSAKGSIDALCGGQLFVKPSISGYPGSIVSAVIEPNAGKTMYEAAVDTTTGMIVVTPGKDFAYDKKGSAETVKLTLDTGAVLTGTLKIKPTTGKLSAGSENRTVKIDAGSVEVPVMTVYSYKYYTSANSYVTRIKMYDIDKYAGLAIEPKQQKELTVIPVEGKGILKINTTASAHSGKTVTVPVAVREQTTGSKASFKIKVSLTE